MTPMTELSAWSNFFVIVGSSAGALIGLQFVVITLIAGLPIQGSPEGANAFATPTTVHFGAVLLLAGLLTIPWQSMSNVSVIWGLLGLIGLLYSALVTRRMRAQSSYQPEFEDWLFHSILPLVAYAILAASAVPARTHSHESMFGVAAASLMLLFIGIHNSWDAVTYHVFTQRRKQQEKEKQQS